jgi:hypothetical protein
MLEVIGFIAVAYLLIKFAPAILEGLFKFAVISIGLFTFIIMWNWLVAQIFLFF